MNKSIQVTNENMVALADEAVFHGDVEIANQVRKFIKQLQSQGNTAPVLADLFVEMEFVCFVSLPETKCLELIGKHLLAGLRTQDFSVQEQVGLKISSLMSIGDEMTFIQRAYRALNENEETLGKEQIIIDKQALPPTVKNWIKDYQNYPSQSKSRDNYGELEYLNKGVNVAKLKSEDREVLLRIIQLYDGLNEQIFGYNSLTPPVGKEEDIFAELRLQDLLPGVETEESLLSLKVKPSGVSKKIATPEIVKSVESVVPAPVPTPKLGFLEEKPAVSARPVSIQDVLKKGREDFAPGLRIGLPVQSPKPTAPVAIDMAEVTKAAEAKVRQQQEEIDKKLDDLKKRV